MADRNGGYHRGGGDGGARYRAPAPVYDDEDEYEDPRAQPLHRRMHDHYEREAPVYTSRGAFYDHRVPEDDDMVDRAPASTSYHEEPHHLTRHHHPSMYRHPSSSSASSSLLHSQREPPRLPSQSSMSGRPPALPTVVRGSMYAPGPVHYDRKRQLSPMYSDEDERLASGSRYSRAHGSDYASHHTLPPTHAPSHHVHPHSRSPVTQHVQHVDDRAHDREVYALDEEELAYRERQEEAAYREHQLQLQQQQRHQHNHHHHHQQQEVSHFSSLLLIRFVWCAVLEECEARAVKGAKQAQSRHSHGCCFSFFYRFCFASFPALPFARALF